MDIKSVIRRLETVSEIVSREFGSWSAEKLNQKPAPEKWSVAQVLDHLIRINESYQPILSQVRAGSYSLPWHARLGFMVRFFGNFILQSVEPTRKRKMKTFPVWEPSYSTLSGDIVTRFLAHQQELIREIQSWEPLIAKGVIICSPANRIIVYKLETAAKIITAHEERHLNQALEVKSNLQ